MKREFSAYAHAVLWTVCAVRMVGRKLARDGLELAHVPPAPNLPDRTRRAVDLVLRAGRVRCLTRALILQSWQLAQGSAQDVVIGVRDPRGDFRAHAWLEGDPTFESRGFHELLRRPPRPPAKGAPRGERLAVESSPN